MQIYLKQLNKLANITNFLAFFQFYLKIFPSWIRIRIFIADPDPGLKTNAELLIHADSDPQHCRQIGTRTYVLTLEAHNLPLNELKALIRPPIGSGT